MRKVIVLTGVVILILGIVLVVVGGLGALGSTTIISTFSEQQAGEYVSTEIVANSSSVVAITSAASNGGLIPAQDLTLVNLSSLSSYVIAPRSAAGGTETYTNITGSYYYVAFASTQPSSRIVVTAERASRIVGFGLLAFGGIVLFVAGIVVAIVGVILKKPAPATPPPDPYYQNTQKNQSNH